MQSFELIYAIFDIIELLENKPRAINNETRSNLKRITEMILF